MNKFTPGPWHMTPHSASEYGEPKFCSMAIYGAEGTFCGDLQIATIISDCIDGHEANARLIAAAPDLLDALEETRKDLVVLLGNITDAAKSCSRWDGMPELIDAWIRRNDAAIAKARGES